MSTLLRWSAAAIVVALSACTVPDLDLEGRACPCADGWTCDPATDTCVQGDVEPATITTTGPGSTSGSSASQTSTSQSTGEGGGPVGPGGGGSSADGGGGAGAGGSTHASSSASTGEGGSDPCGGLAPSVAPCGGVVATFSSAAEFSDLWDTQADPQDDFVVVGGAMTIQLSNDGPAYAETEASLDLAGCAIWTRLVQVTDDPGIMTRLSLGDPGDGSRYSLGPHGTLLEIHDGAGVIASVPYVESAMRWLRIRGGGGMLFFGTSSDGVCWDEHHQVNDVATAVTARLVMLRYEGAIDDVESTFDDFGVTP